MHTVELKPLMHGSMECIGIYSPLVFRLNYYFEKAGAKWSQGNKCWYLPCTEKHYEQLARALAGKAVLEVAEFKKYLLEKKLNNHGAASLPQNLPPVQPQNKAVVTKKVKPLQANIAFKLSTENNEALQKFKQQLVLKSYSSSTIKTYTNEFMQFLQTIGKVPAHEFTTARIKDYMQYCFEKLKLSENTLNSRLNAFTPLD